GMERHLNWFTILLNKIFGGAANALLAAVHVHPNDPAYPIPNFVAGTIAVCLIAMIFFLWLRPRISVDRPGATQQVMEALLTNSMGVGIRDLLDDNVEHHARQYLPMVGSVAIFILFANAISVLPAFESPTGHPSVPLACAILTFAYYNLAGLKEHGPLGYAKHFAGPVWWLSWLIFPVEIISHTARLLSLTVRLWANIFASELIYVIFLGLFIAPAVTVGHTHPLLGYALGIFPAVIPIAFIALHLFVAVIQAFVFTILPALYIGMATAEEH
ncbi:MAG TPA: F0F1 ATP synthase subunit A, partial [Candidatus Dormibacteraeota bacterium]|nr:F0F1 ATP synthase subunit A [Candidatus Dormibacteraeota bacterium]